MMKITTRIFTASAMGAMLISFNSGAFACDGCKESSGKVAAKTVVAKTATTKKLAKATKAVAKTVVSAKIAPKTVSKNAVKLVALQSSATKTAVAVQACPDCEHAKADVKK